MVDIRQRVAARDQLPRTDTRHTDWRVEMEAETAEGIRCTAPGESALVKLLAA